GLVPDIYPQEVLAYPAHTAIGHNRYATQGLPSLENLQPHTVDCDGDVLALSSNGDIPMYDQYRQRFEGLGRVFNSRNDCELLAHAIAEAFARLGTIPAAIREIMGTIEGAYSSVM